VVDLRSVVAKVAVDLMLFLYMCGWPGVRRSREEFWKPAIGELASDVLGRGMGNG
jgi:hypothetical protein